MLVINKKPQGSRFRANNRAEILVLLFVCFFTIDESHTSILRLHLLTPGTHRYEVLPAFLFNAAASPTG